MARTNEPAREWITALLQREPATTLGQALESARKEGVRFSPPFFYKIRNAIGVVSGTRPAGRGRPPKNRATSAPGAGAGASALDALRASLESAQRYEAAIGRIAEILAEVAGPRR